MTQRELSPATQAWQAAGRNVEILGRRIFVVERGSGPALLLLHGYPTSSYDWRDVIDRLAAKFRCIAVDFLGFGLSDKPEAFSYSLFQQTDHLLGLTETLGIREAHIASHDMGTSVHTELLARQQRRETSLRIARSTFLNGSMLQWLAKITPFQELVAANATLPQAMELCRSIGPMYVSTLQSLMRRPECIAPSDQQVMEDLLAYQDGHLRLAAAAVYMRERYLHRERWLGAIEAAQNDAQFVWAQGDPIATAEMGHELHRMFPRAGYHELPELGHFLLMEDPDPVADRIGAFHGVRLGE